MTDDGWEEVTDPTEARSVLGTDGAKRVLGLSGGGSNTAPGGGRPLPQWAAKMADDEFAPYSALNRAVNSFQDGYGGNFFGGLENKAQGLYSGIGTPGQRDWWADFQSTDNTIRNKLFGAALTPHEIEAYAGTTVTPSMDPKEIRQNLARRQEIVKAGLQRRANFLQANGYDHDAIGALLGPNAADFGFGPQTTPQTPAQAASPHAPAVGVAGPGVPPATPGAPRGPAAGPTTGGPVPSGDITSLATGPTRTVNDPKAAGIINALVRRGASADEINAAIAPLGFPGVSQADVTHAQAWLKQHPDYKGSVGAAPKTVPTSFLNRASASPIGTGIIAGVDAMTGGTTDEMSGAIKSAFTGMPLDQAIADANAKKDLAFRTNPVASTIGTLAGTAASYYGGAKLLGGTAASAVLGRAAPYVGAAAFGAASGFGENNDHRVGGAVLGAAGGAIGQGVGDLAAIPIGAGVRAFERTRPGRALGMMFRGYEAPARMSPAQSTALDAINGVGADAIRSTLTDAQRLGVPMSLADTSPAIGELAGSAVRRSPNAANQAEATLLPRSRGQYDRLGTAVSRDLGPIGNIPQISQDLMQQARTAAAPLYDRAYANPAVGSPELDSLLNTPAARSALARARTIAGNERRNPEAMGFALDDQGNVVLNPANPDLHGALASAKSARDDLASQLSALQARAGASLSPSQFSGQIGDLTGRLSGADDALGRATAQLGQAPAAGVAATGPQYTPQTLDYVKRGIDDVIDGLPKGMNGRPIMDENYRAVDGVRRQLLGEVDRLNPDYAAARAAYAGPASSREGLNLGADAVTMQPNELNILAGNQSPERLAQMQTGFRSQMMTRAGNLRDSTNPWEAALGSPNARARVDTLYPGNTGNADLFRQRDLESQMATTTNRILGNSKTAQRHIADEAFGGDSAIPAMAIDAALAMHGGVPVATIARSATKGKIGEFLKMGSGKRAIAKADDLLPMLINTDPAASMATVDDLVRQQLAYRNYVQASRPKRMFGAGFGAAGVAAGSHL